jgi:hypothetical protein
MAKVQYSEAEFTEISSCAAGYVLGAWVRALTLYVARVYRDLPPNIVQLPERSRGSERVTVAFRVTEDELTLFNSVRGLLPRDTWIREASIRYVLGVQAGLWAIPADATGVRKLPSGGAVEGLDTGLDEKHDQDVHPEAPSPE